MDRIRDKLIANEALVAGVLSGTSADGIDVALVAPRVEHSTDGPRLVGLEQRAFTTHAWPAELGERVRAVLDGAALDARGLAILSRDLGTAFGQAACRTADAHGRTLDLVASHGQTVYHHDGDPEAGPSTLQLGDGDFCAEAAGTAVVSDFRQRDLAAGGEGAPLSALVDDLLLADEPSPVALLNLGGIANLSWYGAEGDCLAYDTGPAGCLLDGLARRFLGAAFDEGGAQAAAGEPDAALLERLTAHPYYSLSPPKSTGRDTFDSAWVDGIAGEARARALAVPDLLATAALAVARHVARAFAALPERPARLFVAGGGVHHCALMAALEAESGVPVLSSAAVGLDPDAREALVFAALGVRAVLGEPSTRPGATGARAGRILGKISPSAR